MYTYDDVSAILGDVTPTSFYGDTLSPYFLMGCDATSSVQTAIGLVAYVMKIYLGPVVAALGFLGECHSLTSCQFEYQCG